MTNLKEDKFVHFDLNTPVEENFNKYQDILAECPHKMQAFKLQFDQYLKSKKLHNRQSNKDYIESSLCNNEILMNMLLSIQI